MSGFSLRKPSPRTLVVVNTKTRAIFATRTEDMNRDGMAAARITKPIYDLVKSGDGIMFYAHTPHILRQAVEINGRYFAKPPGWTLGCKPGAKAPKDATTPPVVGHPLDGASLENVKKIYHRTGWGDNTDHIKYDGSAFYVVPRNEPPRPLVGYRYEEIRKWITEGIWVVGA
jgi:hypothetical protein